MATKTKRSFWQTPTGLRRTETKNNQLQMLILKVGTQKKHKLAFKKSRKKVKQQADRRPKETIGPVWKDQ